MTPQTTVNVYSQVSGRVLSVNYQEGQVVRQGQVLVEIDPRPTEAHLEQAQATLRRGQAALQQARTDLQRYENALDDHAIPEQTVSDQRAVVAQDEGTVANDQAAVKYDEVQLGYCHIAAPIGGRIGLRLVDAGNTVFAGSGRTSSCADKTRSTRSSRRPSRGIRNRCGSRRRSTDSGSIPSRTSRKPRRRSAPPRPIRRQSRGRAPSTSTRSRC